jgi:predicted nucleic acid-binding protein
MTPNKAVHALRRTYTAADRIVFDANVLVSLFSGLEPPGSVIVTNYSAAFKQIRTGGAKVLLDVLVLSEFVNVCARKEYELAFAPGAGRPRFKDFRNSPAFVPIAQAIARAAQQIAGFATAVDHAFSRWPLTDLLKDYSTGQHDINDQCLVQLCQEQNAALLTNDKDFLKGGITLLTTNPKLLAACPS